MKKHRSKELEEEFSRKYLKIDTDSAINEKKLKTYLNLTGETPVGVNIRMEDLDYSYEEQDQDNNNNNSITFSSSPQRKLIGAPTFFTSSETAKEWEEGWDEKWGDQPPLRSDGYYGKHDGIDYSKFDYTKRFNKGYRKELEERHKYGTTHPHYAFAMTLTNLIKDSIHFFNQDFFLPGSLGTHQEFYLKQLLEERRATRFKPSELIKQEEDLLKIMESTKEDLIKIETQQKIAYDAINLYNESKKKWIESKEKLFIIDLFDKAIKHSITTNDMTELKNKYKNIIFPKFGSDEDDLKISAEILEKNKKIKSSTFWDFINGKKDEITLKNLINGIVSDNGNPALVIQLEQKEDLEEEKKTRIELGKNFQHIMNILIKGNFIYPLLSVQDILNIDLEKEKDINKIRDEDTEKVINLLLSYINKFPIDNLKEKDLQKKLKEQPKITPKMDNINILMENYIDNRMDKYKEMNDSYDRYKDLYAKSVKRRQDALEGVVDPSKIIQPQVAYSNTANVALDSINTGIIRLDKIKGYIFTALTELKEVCPKFSRYKEEFFLTDDRVMVRFAELVAYYIKKSNLGYGSGYNDKGANARNLQALDPILNAFRKIEKNFRR